MSAENRRIFIKKIEDSKIGDFVEPFFLAKKGEGRAAPTLASYREKLNHWLRWLDECEVEKISELTPHVIRTYLMDYRGTHNQGGTHMSYRVIKTFLRWIWLEFDFEWQNPISKVKCSANQIPPIEGVNPAHIDRIFASAKEGICPERDCAILAVLLDTGIRRSSLAKIRCMDVDLVKGTIFINHVKAGKQYTAHLGRKARK